MVVVGIGKQIVVIAGRTCGLASAQGCTALIDAKMRILSCARLRSAFWKRLDLLCQSTDTNLIPAFRVGKDRDARAAMAFMLDVADRMRDRVQISTDSVKAYVEAIEWAFGGDEGVGSPPVRIRRSDDCDVDVLA